MLDWGLLEHGAPDIYSAQHPVVDDVVNGYLPAEREVSSTGPVRPQTIQSNVTHSLHMSQLRRTSSKVPKLVPGSLQRVGKVCFSERDVPWHDCREHSHIWLLAHDPLKNCKPSLAAPEGS
eukprot:5020045-Amphidinium_carterae.1